MSRTDWPLIGVDPGGRWTGIVQRDRTRVITHEVITRRAHEPMAAYLERVVEGVTQARTTGAPDGTFPRVAVEGLNEPVPQMGITSVRGLLGAAQVLGVVLYRWPQAIVVPPGGHGSGILAAYPAELVGEREKSGTGILRHARSAWDVAGAAIRTARLEEMAGRR